MYLPPFTVSAEAINLIAEISGQIERYAIRLEQEDGLRLRKANRIKTIHSSLLIEGNGLEHEAVTAILDGKRVLGDSRDILEVENAKRAYDLIPELDPHSLEDLLLAHRTMMNGLVADAGRFRTGNVGVLDGDELIHAGTPATYVPEVMADIVGWLKATDMHPLLASCVFHFEFEFCHPFADGNGRVGRLWHTLLLSRWRPVLAWLPVESTIRQRQSGYYAALAKSDAVGSSEAFVEFMLETIRDSLIPFAKPQSTQELAKMQTLAFFKENPAANMSSLAESLGCSKRSAERIVAELKKEGALTRLGSTRSGSWIVIEAD